MIQYLIVVDFGRAEAVAVAVVVVFDPDLEDCSEASRSIRTIDSDRSRSATTTVHHKFPQMNFWSTKQMD